MIGKFLLILLLLFSTSCYATKIKLKSLRKNQLEKVNFVRCTISCNNGVCGGKAGKSMGNCSDYIKSCHNKPAYDCALNDKITCCGI